MDDQKVTRQTVDVLERAQAEILWLRRDLEVLRAKTDTFDACMRLLAASPPTQLNRGESEDVARQIARLLPSIKGQMPGARTPLTKDDNQ